MFEETTFKIHVAGEHVRTYIGTGELYKNISLRSLARSLPGYVGSNKDTTHFLLVESVAATQFTITVSQHSMDNSVWVINYSDMEPGDFIRIILLIIFIWLLHYGANNAYCGGANWCYRLFKWCKMQLQRRLA